MPPRGSIMPHKMVFFVILLAGYASKNIKNEKTFHHASENENKKLMLNKSGDEIENFFC